AKAQAKFQEFAFRGGQAKPGPLVTEDNGLLRGEPKALLSPPAPRVPDRLLQSWGSLRKRANVLLVMDTSGSMGEQVAGTGKSKLELAKQAARNSLSQFAAGDQVGLWMFSPQLDGETDYRAPPAAGGARPPPPRAGRLPIRQRPRVTRRHQRGGATHRRAQRGQWYL